MEPSIYIKGWSKLEGSVTLSGAKNSALKVLSAAILTSEKVRLTNIPVLMEDIKVKLRMLQALGAGVQIERDSVTVDASSIWRPDLDGFTDESVRTTLLLLGALLARFGRARVPLPGGCDIGQRGIDLHILALESLGAHVRVSNGFLEAEADSLHGADIDFPIRTTGGTENAIIVASLAKGHTRIKNAHTRPEVLDLVNFLNRMGAKIRVLGSGYIEVEGVETLQGTDYCIIPDSVEALTFTIGAALAGGEVEICDYPFKHLEVPLIYLRESGVRFFTGEESMVVFGKRPITGIDLSTGSYPGINSDFQPLFSIFATQALSNSRITDIRFAERFEYIHELAKMGAAIEMQDPRTIHIQGKTPLRGAKVRALDLRAGVALLIAGLLAEGETIVTNIRQIDRGYEGIEMKLRQLGAVIERQGEP
jgi:UDP-N-acetylglucosamine 1-carboxyvinyltransferase